MFRLKMGLGFLFLLAGVGWATEALPSVVVMEIQNRTGEQGLDNQTLTEIVELHVVNTRRARVVERQRLGRILDEQKLNLSGLTEREVARVGVLVGASKAIVGSLSQVGQRYILILRLIDTSTATIDEVAELRDRSLENLLDRTREPVAQLMRAVSRQAVARPTPAQETPAVTQNEETDEQAANRRAREARERAQQQARTQTNQQNQQVPPAPTRETQEEETDEQALERLIREARERVRQREPRKAQEPADEDDPEEVEREREAPPADPGAVREESDLVWDMLWNNRWGVLLQIGIVEDAQFFPKRWNFIGVGWGLITLENHLYVGFAFASIQPRAKIMAGYQVGLLPSAGRLLGVQHGLVNTVNVSGIGWQAGFVNTVHETFIGYQSGFINTVGTVWGVQQGFINVAQEVRGVQIGFLNTTGRLYGMQVGFINVSRQNGLPFMVGLNIGF